MAKPTKLNPVLSDEALELVASRFRVLGDQSRLPSTHAIGVFGTATGYCHRIDTAQYFSSSGSNAY